MKNNILSVNLDKQPYTGEIAIKGKLRIKNVPYLKGFFDGSKGYEQVKNVIMGKVILSFFPLFQNSGIFE